MEDHAPSGTAEPDVPGYDVGRCLGRGGSATVWLVTELSTGREYALKCFVASDGTGRGEAEEAVRREVRILSGLGHDHLVQAHSVLRLEGGGWDGPAGTGTGTGESDGGSDGPWAGSLGLIMDYAAGGSLGQLVAGRGSLGPGETVTVLTPIAQALAYLHGQGFTHGDVSPGNVLFTAHGKPLLADLGVARMVADARAVPDTGTEGFRDPAPVDAVRAGLQPERDVYSLAALGWYCLTGRAPEPGAQRPPLPLLVPGVPPALAAALESGLQEDRRLRPSAAELAAAVHRSSLAAPVDLSVSVHPTVIPQLLTRRIPPGTARERRVEELRSLPRRFRRPHADAPLPGPASPAAGNPADAGPEAGRGAVRPGARHSTRRGANGWRPFRRGPYRLGSARPGTAGPSAARPVRPGRRGIRAVAVCLAVLAVLAAAWGLARTALPAPFPGRAVNDAGSVRESAAAPAGPAPHTAAALPPGVQAQLASQDPEEAVRGLAWLRSLAFSSGEFGLLDQVNVPASAAATADGRISGRLKESGRVLAGFTTLLSHVARDVAEEGDGGPSRAVVAVTAGTSAYQERDATGAVLADAAAAPDQDLRLVLATVEGRWRIQDILPAAGAPAVGAPADTGAPAAGAAGG
ncbi:protein kinase [Pseudarthrobacter sp. PvP090]|uniref:protein kinase domain-containing protein n=1 Tax=Pseudarthrobacter sp. PvP090 TaxID=3156393 RepID=UPI0033962EDD